MRQLTPVLLIYLVVIGGCGDDPKPVSKIVGKWRVEDVQPQIRVVNQDPGASVVDYLVAIGFERDQAELAVIQMLSDNTTTIFGTVEFKADGTYITTGGTDFSSGTWELTDEDKSLLLDKGVGELTAEIAVLNDTDLLMNVDISKYTGITGIQHKMLLTLKRQPQ